MQLVEYSEGQDAGVGQKQDYFVELWDVGARRELPRSRPMLGRRSIQRSQGQGSGQGHLRSWLHLLDASFPVDARSRCHSARLAGRTDDAVMQELTSATGPCAACSISSSAA
jgi:hypothetical protein